MIFETGGYKVKEIVVAKEEAETLGLCTTKMGSPHVRLTRDFNGPNGTVRFTVPEPGIYRCGTASFPDSEYCLVWEDGSVEKLTKRQVQEIVESGQAETFGSEDVFQKLHKAVCQAAAALSLIYTIRGFFKKTDLEATSGRCCHALLNGPGFHPGAEAVWTSPGWTGSLNRCSLCPLR